MPEYNDAQARQLVAMFRAALAPLMEKVAPDWLLHHIELIRDVDKDFRERTVIRLVIYPIGEAREVPDAAVLEKGPRRLK